MLTHRNATYCSHNIQKCAIIGLFINAGTTVGLQSARDGKLHNNCLVPFTSIMYSIIVQLCFNLNLVKLTGIPIKTLMVYIYLFTTRSTALYILKAKFLASYEFLFIWYAFQYSVFSKTFPLAFNFIYSNIRTFVYKLC